MRIVIDMQGLQTTFSSHRGVGRYTENLVREMLRLETRHEFYLALNGGLPAGIDRIRCLFEPLLPNERIVTWQNHCESSAFAHGNSPEASAAEIIRETFLNALAPDLIFSTNLQEGLFDAAVTSVRRIRSSALYCSTLHDVVPMFMANDYLGDPRVRQWYEQKIADAKASDVILTVSHASKADIVDKLLLPDDRVVVTENGYDTTLFHPGQMSEDMRERVLAKYGIRRDFIFYIGGNDKHKNIQRLLAAFAILPVSLQRRFDLVLAGKEFPSDREIQDKIAQLELGSQVMTPGFIADEDLPALFRLCELFVFPSTHEGFGLPVLEAMACGAPVVGSNASAVREIIDNPRALFDATSEQDMSAKMCEALSDPSFRAELIEAGTRRAGHYSWVRTAKDLVGLFNRLETGLVSKPMATTDAIDEVARALSPLTPKLSGAGLVRVARSVAESLPIAGRKTRRKLLLDVSSVVIADHRSGIQRVTRAISAELLKSPPAEYSVDLIYTTPHRQNFRFANRYVRETFGIGRPLHEEEVEFNSGDILVFLDLHPGVAISHREHTTRLRNRGVRVYHVVYDILPCTHPNLFWPELCREFGTWAEVVSASDGAICISHAVASELKTYLSEFGDRRDQPFKIGAFHLGADIEESAPSTGMPSDAEEALAAFAERPTFLMVGTVEPRKGHMQTLKAFELLWLAQADVNLVIVGRLGWRMQDAEEALGAHPQTGRRLFWFPDASDEFLVTLYARVTCLIAASEGEGFGLPLIEAAQRGIPIIARDLKVFREVAGKHAWYFPDSKEPAALAGSVEAWLQAYQAERHPLSVEMHWLTWRESAAQLLKPLLEDQWAYRIHGAGALRPGSVLRFDSDRLVWSGFSDAEHQFRWTSSANAKIGFTWGSAPSTVCLSILCSPLDSQRISIALDAAEVFDGVVEREPELIVCALPGLRAGQNTLKLRLPDARIPNEQDRRFLGLALREVQLFERLPGLAIDQVADHNSQFLKCFGFSESEQDFRWSMGNVAWIVFEWASSTKEVELVLRFKTLGRQSLTLDLNGEPSQNGEFRGDDVRLRTGKVSLRHGPNVLRFDLPRARAPGNGDMRRLAIAFRQLEIVAD